MKKLTKIGCKYYKYDDYNNLVIIRLLRIKNKDCYIVRDSNNNILRLKLEEFKQYTELESHGIIVICSTGTMMLDGQPYEDIMVLFFGREQIEANDGFPYIICRHNVFDFLAVNFVSRLEDTPYGLCLSRDTCPANVPFKNLLMCGNILKSDTINIYMDDTLDSILSVINTVNYNDKLKRISSQSRNYLKLNTLRDFLIYNDFMEEIRKFYKIHKVNFEIKNDYLNDIEIQLVNGNTTKIPHGILNKVVEYDYSINLDKIDVDYLLLLDSADKLFIVGFDKEQTTQPTNKEISPLVRDALLQSIFQK